MTLEMLNSLNEDEKCLLYVFANELLSKPYDSRVLLPLNLITSFKKDKLNQIIANHKPILNEQGCIVYESLCKKLNIIVQ